MNAVPQFLNECVQSLARDGGDAQIRLACEKPGAALFGGQQIEFGGDEHRGFFAQFGAELVEFFFEDFQIAFRIGTCDIDHEQEHARAFNMAQKLKPKPFALVRAFD